MGKIKCQPQRANGRNVGAPNARSGAEIWPYPDGKGSGECRSINRKAPSAAEELTRESYHNGLNDPISRKRVAAMDIDDLTTAPRVR